MGAVIVIAIAFGVLAGFAVLAVRYGADSRVATVDSRRPFVPAGII
jgi:hypothetical protein